METGKTKRKPYQIRSRSSKNARDLATQSSETDPLAVDASSEAVSSNPTRVTIRRRLAGWGNSAAIAIAVLSLIATGLQSYYTQSQVSVARDQLTAARDQIETERKQFAEEGPIFDFTSQLVVDAQDPQRGYSIADEDEPVIGAEPASPERSTFLVSIVNSGRSPGSLRDVGIMLFPEAYEPASSVQRNGSIVYCRQGSGEYKNCTTVFPIRLEPGDSLTVSFFMAPIYPRMQYYDVATDGIKLLIDAPSLPNSPFQYRSGVRLPR